MIDLELASTVRRCLSSVVCSVALTLGAASQDACWLLVTPCMVVACPGVLLLRTTFANGDLKSVFFLR